MASDTAATDGPVPCSCGAASCVRPAIHQRCRGCGEGWSAGQVIVVAGGDYGNVYMHEGCVQP